MRSINNLLNKYAISDIAHKIGYKNTKNIPSLETINLTLLFNNKKLSDPSIFLTILYLFLWIQTGQKPKKITAKKSLANFQIFEGDTLGLSVGLRKNQSFAILDSLLNEGIPFISDKNPDFEGFSSKSLSQTSTFGFYSLPIFSKFSPLSGISKKYLSIHTGVALNFCFSKNSLYQNLWMTALHIPIKQKLPYEKLDA